jgi:hypothetical protein
MQACAAGYALTYLTTPKRQLATWTVILGSESRWTHDHILLSHDSGNRTSHWSTSNMRYSTYCIRIKGLGIFPINIQFFQDF